MSETYQGWGTLIEQRNPILSENPFAYRFVRWQGTRKFLTLVQGYKIRFKSMPIQSNPPHTASMSREKEILVNLEVQNLQTKGDIDICSRNPNQFIYNIFTIPKKDGERWSVVHMLELNQFAKYLPFKMDDISQLIDILLRGDYMTMLDL